MLYGVPERVGLTGVSTEGGTMNWAQSRQLCKFFTLSDSWSSTQKPSGSGELQRSWGIQPEPGFELLHHQEGSTGGSDSPVSTAFLGVGLVEAGIRILNGHCHRILNGHFLIRN